MQRPYLFLSITLFTLIAFATAFKLNESPPTEFDNLTEAKAFLEGIGLHCKITNAFTPTMIVTESARVMNSEDEHRFQSAAHFDRLKGGVLVIGPDPSQCRLIISSVTARQWGQVRAIGDPKILEMIEHY